MFQIIQSNDTNKLVDQLIHFYEKNHQHQSLTDVIFCPFVVIVPSMVLGDWLSKQVALKAGISTLLTTEFWGRYQWRMIDAVLNVDARFHDDGLAVPEVAVLSGSVMRWRIFGYLSEIAKTDLERILNDDDDELHFLFKSLVDTQSSRRFDEGVADVRPSILEHRLWQTCDELAKVYVRYLTQRPKWLEAWSLDKPLPMSVEEMIRQKDQFGESFGQSEGTPDWLYAHYHSLERLLRHLWWVLFKEVYNYREQLETRFWQVLNGERGEAVKSLAIDELPKNLYMFTVQQIPPVELMFLKKLSLQINIRLLHFNPSKMFWADIVDKNWLLTQRIIQPQMVYLKDYGHGLLSRLGKESRETFAMLADMSGGDFYYEHDDALVNQHEQSLNKICSDDTDAAIKIDWQDKFVNGAGTGILQRLKQDILMLGEDNDSVAMQEVLFALTQKNCQKPTFTLDTQSDHAIPELSIHACHSLTRQLEIARTMIARYLNTDYGDGVARKLSDVVILLPDAQEAEHVIRSVFPDGVGIDGLRLPIKITGTTDRTIDELMQAIIGFYRLLGMQDARFYAHEFFEWLMNPSVYESFGLGFEGAYRAKALLVQAGFKRGFDARHISQTLHIADTDYRYTFSYALDRIVLGFIAPNAQAASDLLYPSDWVNPTIKDATLPLDGVSLNDAHIVTALCAIHEALTRFSGMYHQVDTVQSWLQKIEHELINDYFYDRKQSVQMRAIFDAKNAMMSSLRANANYHRHADSATHTDDIRMSLEFVLESLSDAVAMQTIAAEPSGVITVARFGALRSIPFGLTLMLGMNLSAFPRQDKNVRLDLMKAGLKRRGDRTNEDDDNGAFLDAILCTKDACAIFYDGLSTDGSTVLLPASPVGELIEFFKSDVDWQFEAANEDVQAVAALLPSLIERYLVTYHHAMSFEKGVFYDSQSQPESQSLAEMLLGFINNKKQEQRLSMPPAPIWQQVRRIIDAKRPHDDKPFATLPSDDELKRFADVLSNNVQGEHVAQDIDELICQYRLTPPNQLTAQMIINAIKSPAKHYLYGKFATAKSSEVDEMNEPLSLDGLGDWQLRQVIIKAFALGVFDGKKPDDMNAMQMTEQNIKELSQLDALYHDAKLPAGVVRSQVLQDATEFIKDQFMAFFEVIKHHALVDDSMQATDFSSMKTTTCEERITVGLGQHDIKVVADMPASDEMVWLNVLVSKASADKLMGFWVWHLIWQIHRQTTEDDVKHGRGASVWQYLTPSSTQLKVIGLSAGSVYQFAPVCANVAKRYLINLVLFALIATKTPLILLPVNALKKALADHEEVVIKHDEMDEYAQLIIGDANPDDVMNGVGQLSVPLYKPMMSRLSVLDDA
ncbi:exodeoxyribonuclease V subunit gamma [Moraxella sp. Tifton1]|uniref:exodeoxyribonuclease V subunit gamma n=1 Tax=Moraxella oculi TaxID=2940516 RepID=UPI002011D485|nr:exodeoxyribonuclease V subunit gamma [Moraxella sp. Tifton1]MCL1623366.1 exodeoxyribonuclease V subunit gamma [Moraxella sp. Tifton1]